MKRLALCSMALIALVCFSPLAVDADFYVIPVPAGVGTKISSLPHTIAKPGYYYIGGNLTSTGTGITVDADNVVIDMCGFTITGPGSSVLQSSIIWMMSNFFLSSLAA